MFNFEKVKNPATHFFKNKINASQMVLNLVTTLCQTPPILTRF